MTRLTAPCILTLGLVLVLGATSCAVGAAHDAQSPTTSRVEVPTTSCCVAAPDDPPPIPTSLVPPPLEIAGATVTVDPLTCRVDITLPESSIGFTQGSAELPSGAETPLGLVAHQFNVPGAISIIGYTSSEGGYALNMALSLARARAVADVIAADLPGHKLVVEGRGPNIPIAPNDTEEQRARNRRVVISGEVQTTSCTPATS